MDMAIEDLNKLQQSQTLSLRVKCSQSIPVQAAIAARHLIDKNKVQAILGPRSWEESSAVAEVCEQYVIPILSFADPSPPWETERWPFLFQASSNTDTQMKAVAAIIQSWGWRRVSVICEDTDSSAHGISPHLKEALQQVDVQISNFLSLPSVSDSSLLHEKLENLKRQQPRMFVVVVHTSLALATRIFETAKAMKMMENDHVWITTDSITSLVHSVNASVISSMQGVVGVRNYFPDVGPEFISFSTRFPAIFAGKYPEEENHEPGIFALQAYDAIWTVGLAMNEGNKNGRQVLGKISETEFNGLCGKIQFKERKLAPAHQFQIIIISRKSHRELGFWSESDGLSYSSNNINSRVYNICMENLGHVYRPALRGYDLPPVENPLRIGVPSGSISNKFVKVEYDPSKNKSIFSGFSVDVFNETVKLLQYSLPYEFIAFGGHYTDLVKQVQMKTFDAAVGDIAIISSRYDYVEFTHPYTESGLVMVVPILSHSSRVWLFVKPFTTAMWLLLVFIYVYNGFVIWSIERNYCSDLKGPFHTQIFVLLRSLSKGEKLHSNLSRMATLVWLFVALILTQSYTASLTSMLTVQNRGAKQENIETLKINDAMIGYSQKSFVKGYLESAFGFKPSNVKNFTSTEDYAQALVSGEIAAAFLETPVAKLFVAKYCKSFTISGPTYRVGGYGFAFPKGSPLLPDIDKSLLSMLETGVVKSLHDSLIASEKCIEIQLDNATASSLGPRSFFVLFMFTVGTSTSALVIYYFRAKSEYKLNKPTFKKS